MSHLPSLKRIELNSFYSTAVWPSGEEEKEEENTLVSSSGFLSGGSPLKMTNVICYTCARMNIGVLNMFAPPFIFIIIILPPPLAKYSERNTAHPKLSLCLKVFTLK